MGNASAVLHGISERNMFGEKGTAQEPLSRQEKKRSGLYAYNQPTGS
jgi:hypothetical protein